MKAERMGDEPEIDVEVTLRGPLAKILRKHAERLGSTPAEVFADIVETVLTDDLVVAVLDR